MLVKKNVPTGFKEFVLVTRSVGGDNEGHRGGGSGCFQERSYTPRGKEVGQVPRGLHGE